MVILWVHHLILAEIFLIWEKIKHVQLEGIFEFIQSFLVQFFVLSFMGCDKNWPFLILYEK